MKFKNYILVTEEEDGDCDAFILKELSAETDTEASYEMVESEEELEYMLKIFAYIPKKFGSQKLVNNIKFS